MSFGFTEAQEMFRREVRNFAQREIAPRAKERDRSDLLPRELARKMAELGLLGITIPQKYGGLGADWISLGIAIEEMSKVDLFSTMFLATPGVASLCLEHASEEVRQEWIPQLVKGEKFCCFAVTEADTGSDAAAIRTTAVRDGDHYILNGEKMCITMAMQADASIIFAKTDPKAKAKGVTCFWVPYDLPGVSLSRILHSGYKPTGTASIRLDQVEVPDKYRVGEEGRGFVIFAAAGADYLRICLSMQAVAAAEASLDETKAYALQRTAFGHPIAKFEGVAFKLAEHATHVEAARLLCYKALYLKDQGLPHTKESAMCKWWCPEVAVNAIHDCLLIHGHLGYSEEYPLEQRLRDAIGYEYADGTAQIMKIVIARELMGRAVVPY